MKLKEFIKYCKKKREDWQDIDIFVRAPIGIIFEPKVKAVLKDIGVCDLRPSNVEYLVITDD